MYEPPTFDHLDMQHSTPSAMDKPIVVCMTRLKCPKKRKDQRISETVTNNPENALNNAGSKLTAVAPLVTLATTALVGVAVGEGVTLVLVSVSLPGQPTPGTTA